MIAEAREKRRRDDYAIAQTIAEGLAEEMATTKAEGMAKTMAQGMAETMAETMAQGMAKTMAQGMAETIAEAKVRQEKLEIARKLKARNISPAQIAEDTGLSPEEVANLRN
jgi:flagellar biosynthesis/type III secretory pathway protein FliH